MTKSSNRRRMNSFYPLFLSQNTNRKTDGMLCWYPIQDWLCWYPIQDWLSHQVDFKFSLYTLNSFFFMSFPTVSAFGRNSAQRVFKPPTTFQVPTALRVFIQSVEKKYAVDLHSVIITPVENHMPLLRSGKTQLSPHQVLNSCVNINPALHSSAWSPDVFFDRVIRNTMGCWAPALVWMPSWKFPLKFRGSSHPT